MRRKVATGVTTLLSTMMLMTPVMAASTSSAASASSSSSPTTTVDSSSSSDLTKNFTLPKSTRLVKSKFSNRGSVVTFDLFFQVGNGEAIKSVNLVDPLNDDFQFLKTKVLYVKTDTEGNTKTTDVTDEGKASFDSKTNTTNWKANAPSDWFGQVLDMRVKVKVNKQVDLSKIPNQGYSQINDKKTKTDTVHVSTLKPATPKPVVKTPTKTITKEAKVVKATKKGLLPQTGQMIADHLWQIITAGIAIIMVAGVALWRSKKRGGN